MAHTEAAEKAYTAASDYAKAKGIPRDSFHCIYSTLNYAKFIKDAYQDTAKAVRILEDVHRYIMNDEIHPLLDERALGAVKEMMKSLEPWRRELKLLTEQGTHGSL